MKDSGDSQPLISAVKTERDYLSVIFRRCVLALAGSRVPEGTVFERGMLEELVVVAEQYLVGLMSHLVRIAGIQRRAMPSIGDLALLLHMNELNVLDLEREFALTPQIEETKPVSSLNSLYFDPNEEDLPFESLPFFERPHQLVAPSRQKPAYIPSWMPQLPADHTYMHTASLSSEVRDLRQVRVSLVEEGRLAEKALQRLLGDKGSSSIIDLRRPEPETAQKMVIVDKDVESGMDVDAGDEPEPAKSKTIEPKPEPAEEPINDSPAPPAQEDGADAPVPASKPLKLQLHIGKAPSTPAPEPADDDHKKLSLKLSLGKPKKKKEAGFLGKRPRSVDIVDLARKAGDHDSRNDPDEGGAGTTPKETPHIDSFQAALSSFVR